MKGEPSYRVVCANPVGCETLHAPFLDVEERSSKQRRTAATARGAASKRHQNPSLKAELIALRPKLAKAAQGILDGWEQDEEGFDEVLGMGGPCDAVSSAMASVIANELPSVQITDGGQEGDDHAYLLVYDDKEAFAVDIPPGVYETGGGYRWTKRADVELSPSDVVVEAIDRRLLDDREE